MASNLIVLAEIRAAIAGDDSSQAPTSMERRRTRFPVADGLGMYCWFCASALDVERAQATERPVGEGRYQRTCPDCRHDTCFDRSEELEDDA